MKHVDCLFRCWVVSVLKTKLFDYSTGFHLVFIESEKLGDCARLFGSKEPLPKFNLAQMSLIHFGSRRHDSQR